MNGIEADKAATGGRPMSDLLVRNFVNGTAVREGR